MGLNRAVDGGDDDAPAGCKTWLQIIIAMELLARICSYTQAGCYLLLPLSPGLSLYPSVCLQVWAIALF